MALVPSQTAKAASGRPLFFRGRTASRRPLQRLARLLLLTLLCGLSPVACAADSTAAISREQAIELARPHVDFEPETVEAEKDTDDGRPVWRVTFRGKPGPHPMGSFMEVLIDRRSGEVVGLAQS